MSETSQSQPRARPRVGTSRPPPSSPRRPTAQADLYDAADGRPRGLLGRPGPRAAQLGQGLRPDPRLERARRSPSGSSAASSTSPTTASTGTSRPATATGSRSTSRASRATPAPSPTPTCSARWPRPPTRSTDLGVGKGDRVAIYLPMIPEAVVAMLACARIGAPHSRGLRRVLGRARCAPASTTPRPSSSSPPTAATGAASPRRSSRPSTRPSTGDDDRRARARRPAHRGRTSTGTTAATSGGTTSSTGRATSTRPQPHRRRAPAVHPLHVRHHREAEGHPAHHRRLPHPGGLHATRVVHDLHPETDVYWCTADIGWVTGHCYIVYGPLANGATQVIYEGTPDTPHQGRWWEIVEKYKVSILYTAPTAIRTFMKWGDDIPAKFDLSSLRVLGSGRRADQPRGVDLVPQGHRRRPAPRSSTPGGRPRPARIMISPLPGVTDAQARLGAAAAPRHQRRRRRRRGQAGARRRRRRLPRARPSRGRHAARHLGRPGALQGDLLVAVRRRSTTSPATAPSTTTTATSGCSAGSTTS